MGAVLYERTGQSQRPTPKTLVLPTTREGDDNEGGEGKAKGGGYVLEFDAARKIAQGLGAHLEQLPGVIEVKGDKARLLSVAERTKRLFGNDEADVPQRG